MNALLELLKETLQRSTGVCPLVVADGWPSLLAGLAADSFRAVRVGDAEDGAETAFYKRFEPREFAERQRTNVVRVRRGSPGGIIDGRDAHVNVDVFVEILPELQMGNAGPAITCILVSGRFAVRVAIDGLPAEVVDGLRAGQHAFDDGTGSVSMRFPIEPGLAGTLVVAPHRIFHDGSYQAESDGGFQWLWTGPDRHSRLLLGSLETRPATLKVTIMSEGCPGNGEKIKTFINGVARAVHFEPWGNGSGRLTTTVEQDDENPLVLSLLVPAMHDVEGRRLGVCVGTLEFSRKAE